MIEMVQKEKKALDPKILLALSRLRKQHSCKHRLPFMEMEEWLRGSNQEPKNEAKMTEHRATENYPQALKPNQGTMARVRQAAF